ncbi:MAG: dockerin type I repeat-containing protein [Phycisphaerae bacterium]|nr:dockerin type I repeat-containing protein [Phycisphaerae bacterium]
MKSARLRFLMGLAPLVTMAAQAEATNPRVINDPYADAVIRRTDRDNDGWIDPKIQRLPDLLQIRIGRFQPTLPHVDRFSGSWSTTGAYLRLDLVLHGLINPPGPVGWDDSGVYDPLRYGPHPAYGYVELDVDSDENTGGELDAPQYRYLAQIGRFGGVPTESWYAGRVAIDRRANDYDFLSPPFIDRSGEEFHLVLRGEEMDSYTVRVEKPGGDPDIFEEGEQWELDGDFFHRAHGFENYAFQCVGEPGRYKPHVKLLYTHQAGPLTTTISLVYPLTNAASAALADPGTPVQPQDGCENNQNSISEALEDLRFSATFADPWTTLEPEFQLIAGWATKQPALYLEPSQWRVNLLLGTAYAAPQSSYDRFIWTDAWPNVTPGDFDGDGTVTPLDAAIMTDYVASVDGDPLLDSDALVNGVIAVSSFSRHFILYDVNYDGMVDALDLPGSVILGDMDLSGTLDINDVNDFVMALIDPEAYMTGHGGESGLARGDINGDQVLDALDIQPFVELLLATAP